MDAVPPTKKGRTEASPEPDAERVQFGSVEEAQREGHVEDSEMGQGDSEVRADHVAARLEKLSVGEAMNGR